MQDLPPSGGFPLPLNYQRNVPSRGPSGAVLLAGVTGVVLMGLLAQKRSMRIKQELEREKIQGRLQLMPLMLAEGDRVVLQQEAGLLELERAAAGLMGSNAENEPVYHNQKNYIGRSVFSL